MEALQAQRDAVQQLSINYAVPVRQAQQRIADMEAELNSLRAQAGTSDDGDLKKLEGQLHSAEDRLAKVDSQRTELMARKDQLSEDRARHNNQCAQRSAHCMKP